MLYAVKNDEGEWLELSDDGDPVWTGVYGSIATIKRAAQEWAKRCSGHVVELVEAPEKIVVSEDEADILKRAANDRYPASFIMGAVASNDALYADKESEDRLVRAYVNGWTVEKPKHYVLPMEGTKLADGTIAYATLDHTGVWTIKAYSKKQSAVAFHNTVTQAEIDAAPDWVKAITPVEVTDDEQ